MDRELEVLMQTFHFSAVDLAKNGQGRITENQRILFQKKFWSSNNISFTITAILIFGPLYLLPVILERSIEVSLLSLPLIAPALLLVYLNFRLWLRLRSDLHDEKAASIYGELKLDTRVAGNPVKRVLINDAVFILTNEQVEPLQIGKNYCFYYLPRSKFLLSIKPIRNPNEHDHGKS